jgi:hypothetical protein
MQEIFDFILQILVSEGVWYGGNAYRVPSREYRANGGYGIEAASLQVVGI